MPTRRPSPRAITGRRPTPLRAILSTASRRLASSSSTTGARRTSARSRSSSGASASARSRRVSTPTTRPSTSTSGKPWWRGAVLARADEGARAAERVVGGEGDDRACVMCARTGRDARKSATYSPATRTPRRAIFSVMIELRIARQETEVGRGAAAEQRQEADRLPRGLEGEHDRRQQRARGAGEHRRHADQRGDARVDAERAAGARRRPAPSERAEPAADGEQRRQRAARGAAAERDRPRDELQHAQRRRARDR